MDAMMKGLIQPDWPAPANILAFSTSRCAGVSTGPWTSLNLGANCGDKKIHVEQNRSLLNDLLPAPAQWMRQVHGTTVLRHRGFPGDEMEGDAMVALKPGRVCAVLTADCLPVLFCSESGDRVAVAHAGWRGLASGVLQQTIDALDQSPDSLMAWMGPAIGPGAYEVGEEVTEAFAGEFPAGFKRSGDRYLMDIYALARMKLEAAGLNAVYGGGFCTLTDEERFFSYRRDGVTGRMASLIWINAGGN